MKISHIVFSTLLLLSTMGMAVSKHYCHGQLISVSFFEEAESCCDDPGCCQNEDHFYQVKEDYSIPVILTVPVLAEIDVMQNFLADFVFSIPAEFSEENITLSDDPPPPTVLEFLAGEQVYLL